MRTQRAGNIASLMMLIWLAFYILFARVLPQWMGFMPVVGCTVPMLLFGSRVRGSTYGTRDCNVLRYRTGEYAVFFVFCICGCALLSALGYIVGGLLSAVPTLPRTDFPYMLVFSCFLPAFFEEWLLRGGVLGAVAHKGGAGVWTCGVLFMLMHLDPAKWIFTLFAGVCITALVYQTECIYLGMLLHFVNNVFSLLLSLLPSETAEYIALGVIFLCFVASALVLCRIPLGKDVRKLLFCVRKEDFYELLSPLFFLFAAATVLVILL